MIFIFILYIKISTLYHKIYITFISPSTTSTRQKITLPPNFYRITIKMENPELHDDKSQDVPPRVVDINQPGLFRLPVIVTHYDTEQSILQFKSYSGRVSNTI